MPGVSETFQEKDFWEFLYGLARLEKKGGGTLQHRDHIHEMVRRINNWIKKKRFLRKYINKYKRMIFYHSRVSRKITPFLMIRGRVHDGGIILSRTGRLHLRLHDVVGCFGTVFCTQGCGTFE